ncbi:rp42 related [Anaeramoeba flamelloides]|uniref:Defective in cullin neddylation protein n=1 Tax=Anaeramoeba flamelloides TaxID=1746091 RepID=A0AAV7ZGK0_9EUKA|nr:rp42 related [Anaeramoeba flamelloides]
MSTSKNKKIESKNLKTNSQFLYYQQDQNNVSFRTDQNNNKKRTNSPPLFKNQDQENEKSKNKNQTNSETLLKSKSSKRRKEIKTDSTLPQTKKKKILKFFRIKKKKTSKKKILRLYKQYKDKQSEGIEANGIKKFFKDLQIDLLNIGALIISWKLNAKVMGMYTKKEFVEGWFKLDCDSLEKMKRKYLQFREEIENDQQVYKQFYYWVFEYGKEEKRQTTMSKETAIVLWEILLRDKFKLFQNWVEFLKSEENKSSVITRDTWKVFWEFVCEINNGWDDYDTTSSWPLLFDRFYSYMKK